MSPNTCFPEPSVEDPRVGFAREARGTFLRRSTWERAVDLRRFYNENLAALPARAADRLCAGLHRDRSDATHFELVVGRFLQVLGAELEYEVPGTEGRRVDWLARFDDGAVSVEATAPVVNAVIGKTYAESLPVVELLLPFIPRGWQVVFASVPRFGASESKRWFKRAGRELLATIPVGRPGARHEVEQEFPNGVLEIQLFGGSDPEAGSVVAAWPAVGYMDDTSEVVRRAIEGKRAQARGAKGPAVAALYTGGFGAHESEQFDIALFGRTVVTSGGRVLGVDPSGAFGKGDGRPTFAAALAFANRGMRGGPDPMLYVHPRFDGSLPSALMSLERRELTASRIRRTPAAQSARLMTLEWPTA